MSKVIIIDYIWKRKESLDDDDNWIQHRKRKRETIIYVKGSILSFIIAASIGLSMSPRTHTHTGIFRFGSLISTVCVCVCVQSVIYSKVITWDLAISLTRWSLKKKKKIQTLVDWLVVNIVHYYIFYIWVIKASFVVVVVVVV